jgi:DNA polymerase III alpha subunit
MHQVHRLFDQQSNLSISRTEEIISDIKAGKMVILVDEEDRENEGDLVFAADFVTPEAINFMARFARGLICLTRHPEQRLLEIFGRSNVYAELQRHHQREEEAANQAIVERARRLRIPLVAANGVAYATPAQRELLDVFTCVRNHVTLARAGRLLERNAERHVKTPAEMARLFADLPEALSNTLEISSRLEFTLADLGYEFPRYPVPEGETSPITSAHSGRSNASWR